ncbi:hypothetical protein OJAV_G00111650 [Oryzias javanicus]|uniref:Uncharacterized protein n=1 Tax=Oryzias javanicus TaxID=123683 RepID=A0A3S2MU30_ORYJA|nr:hypothetical protein OJAV_G00111650 [Oryzias javanicus]
MLGSDSSKAALNMALKRRASWLFEADTTKPAKRDRKSPPTRIQSQRLGNYKYTEKEVSTVKRNVIRWRQESERTTQGPRRGPPINSTVNSNTSGNNNKKKATLLVWRLDSAWMWT